MDTSLMNYKPFTVEQVIALDLPGAMIKQHLEDVELARDLTAEMVPGMTDFQIVEFVVGDLPDRVTPYGVYQQCLREIGTRYESILGLQTDWEKNRAMVMIHQASIEDLEMQLCNFPSGSNPRKKIEARLVLKKALLDDLLRRMPLIDLKARDIFRQLQAFLGEYRKVKDLVPKVTSREEQFQVDRLEWEARFIVRCWRGRLNYLPGHFSQDFVNDALDLAIVMREHSFSPLEVRQVASEPTLEARWKKAELVIEETRKSLPEPGQPFFPLDAQDQLFELLIQKRQVEAKRRLQEGQQPNVTALRPSIVVPGISPPGLGSGRKPN